MPKLYHRPDETNNLTRKGEQLRKLRTDLGLTAKDAARLASVTDDSLIAWELHGWKPQPEKLRRPIRDEQAARRVMPSNGNIPSDHVSEMYRRLDRQF